MSFLFQKSLFCLIFFNLVNFSSLYLFFIILTFLNTNLIAYYQILAILVLLIIKKSKYKHLKYVFL